MASEKYPKLSHLKEVALLFLRLGATAFGGPAAHIAIMHDETVKRRKWLSDQEFLGFFDATNLIPGSHSTEMSIHIGFLRAGWPRLVAVGVSFILPAMLIVLFLAWLHVQFGSTAQAEWLLYGIKPVVIAIIVQPLWNLGIAVGSAAKVASLHDIDCRCQTRVATAARHLGIIQADLAVALFMSISHKNIFFDKKMPEVKFDD